MSLFLKKEYLAFLLLAFFFSSSAAMDVSTYEELKQDSRDVLKIYISGIGEGYSWSNAIVQGRGDAALYCPPEKIALNAENYISITDDKIEALGDSEASKIPVELILNFGLVETFPCAD
ncbi:hypothetical protein E0L35_09700 [Halomonas sp. ATBC28]|uniref:hypothetical protein n=1 Tax=Halomonas sp. ATBC28 TaxID=2545264 RepID=UPI00110DAA53|nr:hypothetical protein [Halomonas sp. ATBC28]TMU24512.1 hypothetical protein E0L35_09700 [Halomonas sp. ATBC28]